MHSESTDPPVQDGTALHKLPCLKYDGFIIGLLSITKITGLGIELSNPPCSLRW